MKNKKFTSLLLATMLLLSCIVTGCGKSITPKESAQICWEVGTGDISNASKINMTEEEAKNLLKRSKENTGKKFKDIVNASGLTITNEQINELCDSTSELTKKATVTIEEVSNDGKTAQVKYKTTYIDAKKLGEKAGNDALEYIKTLGLTSEKEAMDKYSEVAINNLINEYKNATYNGDTKEKIFTFEKEREFWLPKERDTFFESLGGLVAGHDQ